MAGLAELGMDILMIAEPGRARINGYITEYARTKRERHTNIGYGVFKLFRVPGFSPSARHANAR